MNRIYGLRTRFRLKQIDYDGAFAYSPEVDATVEVPGTHVLLQAYPNPFYPRTRLGLTVATEQLVRVEIFDNLGRHVETLFSGRLEAHTGRDFVFDANGLPSGLYFYQVTGEFFTDGGGMTLLR